VWKIFINLANKGAYKASKVLNKNDPKERNLNMDKPRSQQYATLKIKSHTQGYSKILTNNVDFKKVKLKLPFHQVMAQLFVPLWLPRREYYKCSKTGNYLFSQFQNDRYT